MKLGEGALAGTVHTGLTIGLTIAFFLASAFFVWRSFYGMRIGKSEH
jgi:hypothetical protein